MGLTILFFALIGVQIAIGIVITLTLRDIRNALFRLLRRLSE